jgi:class 3 adenylate cyclase/predicted ATPase/ribosomal protein L40E
MTCPKCAYENPSGMTYCGRCGTKLAFLCPSCDAENPPDFIFCGKCGSSLSSPPPSSSAQPLTHLTSPQAYIPKHLAEKILSSRSSLEGERKQVTVLFADIKGSMELLADRDPEEARKILDPVLEHMMEAVHRYEGTVNQVMGDGIMALFGAPLAHEDHAVRACYAGLRMQESVKRYADGIRRTEGIPIQIRVGLNSGEVVVRTIGSDLKMDYTAIGQTTHLAARMEQMATPGSIMMTADALRLAEGYVHVKPLGPVNVKGLSELIEVFEVTGAGAARSRLEAAAVRGLTRFVGRDAEIETLRQALESAQSGHGQVVAVVGEPGVGKSRLFWEFTHSHRTQRWLILKSSSVSYGKATAYFPIIDLLKAYFKIQDLDDHRQIREKITGKLLTLDEALKPTLPAFLQLLDVPVDDPEWQVIDPPQRRQRTLDAVKRLLLRESRVQPLLLIFEDLHWIDSETQAFLNSLIESLPTARLLLLVNYRPEYQHAWGSKTYYTQLRLDPLPPESSEELLQSLLGDDPGFQPLKQLLIDRTEGNPFFLEESVRTLVETKALTGEQGAYSLVEPIEGIQVPATVQAVLAARIDRLSPEEKGLLQSASVIGENVPLSLLQAVVDMSEEGLRRSVAHLQAAEFFYETSLFPELEYTFKHGLTQQVAYGSLLQERRRILHIRIAEAIERLHPDRLAEQVELLAHHALRGEVWEKAVAYLRQAGAKAAGRSAYGEAINFFREALGALDHLPESKQKLGAGIDIRVELGPALAAKGGYSTPEVEETYSEARDLCRRLGEPPQLFPVLWGLARLYDFRGKPEAAREIGGQLLSLAERVKDTGLLLEAHHTLWATSFNLGELSSVLKHTEHGIELYDPKQHRQHASLYGGHDPGVCCANHAARALWLLGYPDQALKRSQQGLALARQLSHPYSMALSLYWAAWVHQLRGEVETFRERVETGQALSEEFGFLRWKAESTIFLGWRLVHKGHLDQGIEGIRQGISSLGARASAREGAYYSTLLAEAYSKADLTDDGLNVITEALVSAHKTGIRYYEAELHRVKGELLLRQAVPAEKVAETCFQEALKVAQNQGAKSLEMRAVMSLSRLWRRQGKQAEARRFLAEIYGWFTEGFDTADLKAAKALLEELS